jgi:hypothetical protein
LFAVLADGAAEGVRLPTLWDKLVTSGMGMRGGVGGALSDAASQSYGLFMTTTLAKDVGGIPTGGGSGGRCRRPE